MQAKLHYPVLALPPMIPVDGEVLDKVLKSGALKMLTPC